MTTITTHELATALQRTAEFLLSKPDLPGVPEFSNNTHMFYNGYEDEDKDAFLRLVRAFGSGKKEWDKDNVTFTPDGTVLHMQIPRSLICRKIKDAEYECDPLFDPSERKELDEEQYL